MATRPRRQRRGDRLVCPDASRGQVMCDHAIASFDRAARQMETKWGFDRLPELVDPVMGAKYGGAIAYLNEAIAAEDPDKCAAAAQNCIKGLAAMDAAATAAGHQPPQAIAHGDVDGFAFRIVADAAAAAALPDDGVPAFSMREIGVVLRAHCQSAPIEGAKKYFPGAELRTVPDLPAEFWNRGGDEIPF